MGQPKTYLFGPNLFEYSFKFFPEFIFLSVKNLKFRIQIYLRTGPCLSETLQLNYETTPAFRKVAVNSRNSYFFPEWSCLLAMVVSHPNSHLLAYLNPAPVVRIHSFEFSSSSLHLSSIFPESYRESAIQSVRQT